MREKGSFIAICAVTVAVFASPSAGAVPLSGHFVLNGGMDQAITTQKARHVCRGSQRRRCYYTSRRYYTSRPEQTTRHFNEYYRSGWNGM
jgi:hypothetical protein